MVRRLFSIGAAAAALSAAIMFGTSLILPEPSCAAEPKFSFAEDVVPILKGRCQGCHQPGGIGFERSGLDLTSYAGLMKGTRHGPVVVAGDPGASNLMWLLDWRAAPELRMPYHAKKLSTCDRDDIRGWICEGAKDN